MVLFLSPVLFPLDKVGYSLDCREKRAEEPQEDVTPFIITGFNSIFSATDFGQNGNGLEAISLRCGVA